MKRTIKMGKSNNIIEMFMRPTVESLLDKTVKEAFDINSYTLDFRMLHGCVSCVERDFWHFMFNNPDVLATPVLEKYEGCSGATFLVISKSYLTENRKEITLCGLFIDCAGEIEYSMYSPEIATNGNWEKFDLENENKTISDYLDLIDEWYFEDKEEW